MGVIKCLVTLHLPWSLCFSDPMGTFLTASAFGRLLPLGDNIEENFITPEHSCFDFLIFFFLPEGLEQPLLTTNLLKSLKMKVCTSVS